VAETGFVKRHVALILAVICFVYLAQVTIFVVKQDTWFDPAFSLETVNAMKTTSINWQSYDVNPPVYYYALYGWMKLNPGFLEEYWGRELSALFGTIFIVFAYFALRKLFGKSGEYATIFLALSTTYIEYGVEIRGYALILLLSAIVLWGIAYSREKYYSLYIAALALFILPFVHYYAAMATFFFVVVFYVYGWDEFGPTVWFGVALLGLMGIIGTGLAYFIFAKPQLVHIVAIWPDTDFSIFPSALMSSFFYILDVALVGVSTFWWIKLILIVMYFATFILIGFYAYVLMKWLFKKNEQVSKRKAMLMVMSASALFPLTVLIVLSVSKVLPSYHHRYFLVVLWMFAAAGYVLLSDWLTSLNRRVAMITLFGLMIFLGILFYGFFASANHDLQKMGSNIPCGSAIVVHESPFSHAPMSVFSREHDCNWDNLISTNMTEKQASGMGMDAVARDKMYWNMTFPEGSMYIVHADENHTLPNRTTYVVYKGDGVELLYVGAE